MIGILSTSTGNTGSVRRALKRLDIPARILMRPEELAAVDGLLFPGVGSAGSAMRALREGGWVEPLRAWKRPFLGICLGMQLLFDYSEEGGTECLGMIRGRVRELPAGVMKPHMGWNVLSTGEYAYFVHSYVCMPADPRIITLTAQHGVPICAGVRKENLFGLQWHPEKSGRTGDRYLLSFATLCK